MQVLPFWKDIKRVVTNVKVVRVMPTDGSKRLVGLRVWPNRIDEVVDLITRGGASQGGEYDDRQERIVSNPFHKVISTVAMHDCLNPAARDTVAFDLPKSWHVDPSNGDEVN